MYLQIGSIEQVTVLRETEMDIWLGMKKKKFSYIKTK